ncbi:hypothetical protein LXL04_035053 [Taraxacum kok-saghyz]
MLIGADGLTSSDYKVRPYTLSQMNPEISNLLPLLTQTTLKRYKFPPIRLPQVSTTVKTQRWCLSLKPTLAPLTWRLSNLRTITSTSILQSLRMIKCLNNLETDVAAIKHILLGVEIQHDRSLPANDQPPLEYDPSPSRDPPHPLGPSGYQTGGYADTNKTPSSQDSLSSSSRFYEDKTTSMTQTKSEVVTLSMGSQAMSYAEGERVQGEQKSDEEDAVSLITKKRQVQSSAEVGAAGNNQGKYTKVIFAKELIKLGYTKWLHIVEGLSKQKRKRVGELKLALEHLIKKVKGRELIPAN